MPKHGKTLDQLEQEKTDKFLDKIRAWTLSIPAKDVRFAYYTLLIYMAGKIPLVDQDQIIASAKALYKQINR